MNERSTRGPGRRVGRERVLEAAVELFEQADLADLLSFLGNRAVAEAADVQPATVHHHFANRDENPKHNARLAAAVLDACLRLDLAEQTASDVRSVADAGEPDVPGLRSLRDAAQSNLEHFIADRRLTLGTFAGATAAANDPIAREALCHTYESLLEVYGPVFSAVADYVGRRFDTEHGFTPEAVSVFATALVDGLVLRHQFDPERVRPDLFAELVLRLFEAVTVPEDTDTADDAVVERLLRRRTSLDLPAASQLDHAKRHRVVDAVRKLFESGGAAAITVTGVAREAGVSRGTVIANFGDRSGLAGAVWAQYVPELERRLEADQARAMPLARTAERHLQRVVDLCKRAPDLTVLLLDGMIGKTIRRGAPTYQEPDDPRSSVPLAAMLGAVLHDAASGLRPGVADSPDSAKDLAATITYLTMVRAMSRPTDTTSEIVQHIMDMVLDGIVARREDDG